MTVRTLQISILRCAVLSSASFYAAAVVNSNYWLMIPHGAVMFWMVYTLTSEEARCLK